MLTATTWVLEALTYHSLQWCSFLTRFGSGSTKYSFSDLANRQSDIHQGMDIRFVACDTFEDTMAGITPTFDHGIEWTKHRISPSCGQFAQGDRPARRGSEGTGMLHLDENNGGCICLLRGSCAAVLTCLCLLESCRCVSSSTLDIL